MTDIQNTLSHDDEGEISLLDILVTLAESWKLLIFGPLVVGALAAGLCFLLPSTYESVGIARLAEEEAALFHAVPVLDSLVEKFGYLERADGIREDARNAVKTALSYSVDKKTKLVTLVAKGSTPEQAQAMGQVAFESLFAELVPKGNEKEAILQEIAINNQLIAEGVDYVDRSVSKLNPGTSGKSQIANLKLNNLELQFKLKAKGSEVFVQKPSLPRRKSAPKGSLVAVIAVLISGVALVLWVFLLEAWNRAEKKSESEGKIKRIKAALGIEVVE